MVYSVVLGGNAGSLTRILLKLGSKKAVPTKRVSRYEEAALTATHANATAC